MNRNPRVRPRLTLLGLLPALLLLSFGAAPAAAAPPTPTPNFVRPSLFEGFEPIEPDEFGISPDFEYFVFQDADGFHVVRLFDGVETFQLKFLQGVLEVGFDPEDERLFLLEPLAGGDFRFRFVDPFSGAILRDERTSDRPTIRTNFNGTTNVFIEPVTKRSRVLVFDQDGAAAFRRTYGAFLRVAMDLFFPVVAFLEGQSNGSTRVEVVNAASRIVTLRTRIAALSIFGFGPFSSAFVIAQPLSSYSFRVRMIDALSGDPLLNRSFSGPVNAGFTPDGSLLGIVSRRGLNQQAFLFRTLDGFPVP